MNRTNVEFLRAQLSKSVEKLLPPKTLFPVATDNIDKKFRVQFDLGEAQEPKTNMDGIMFYHAIPNIADKELTLDEVCDILVPGTNEIPLWIKIALGNRDNLFILKISKRFRKRKVVEEWHGKIDILPVMIDKA